jgi:predicted nucleic-acid-binding Zn-ribbon protein
MKPKIDLKGLVHGTALDFLNEFGEGWMEFTGDNLFELYDPENNEYLHVDSFYLDGQYNLCFKENEAHHSTANIWFWNDINECNYATIYNAIYELKETIEHGKVSNS